MNEIVQGYISTVLTERATGAPSPYDQDTGMSRSFLPYRGTGPVSSPAAAAIAAAFSERDDAVYRGDLVVTGIGTDVMDRFVGLPRGVSAAISGTGLGPFAALGAAMSSKNLTRIQEKQRVGEEGYAIGMLNGRIVGVSPGIGGPVLSGVLPEGISARQRQSIAQQLLEMSGPRFQPDEGIGGPAADNPNLKTGRTYSETAFGVGTYEGGTRPPDSIGPAAFVVDTPTTNYISDPRIDYKGVNRPDPYYTPPPDYAYQGDPGGDTGLAPTGGATTPRDDQDDEKPAGRSYSINDPSRNPADRGYAMMADGGTVQGTGFVSGSPDNYTKAQTVADDENRQVREGAFVLNAPTTEKLQKAGLLPTGVDNSGKNTTIKASKGGLMDVALSKGEYVIEPEEAQRIGYSFLEQLNNGGKAEVDRRQAAADGGFINGYQDGGITLPQPSPVRQRAAEEEDIPLPDIPNSFRQKLVAFMKPIVDADRKPNRTQINNFIKSLNPREQLAFLFLTETVSNSAPMVEMENLGEVVFNRVDSDYRDFSKLTNQEQVLLQHVDNNPKKSKQFTGLEPSTVFARAKEVVGGLAEPGLRKAYAASENVHSDDPDRASLRRLPYATVFYTKKDAPNQWMRKSKDLEYAGEEGGHEYYRPISISVEGAQEAAQKYRYTNINPEFP